MCVDCSKNQRNQMTNDGSKTRFDWQKPSDQGIMNLNKRFMAFLIRRARFLYANTSCCVGENERHWFRGAPE